MSYTSQGHRKSVNWTVLFVIVAMLAVAPSLTGVPKVKAASLCGAWDTDWTASSAYYVQNNVWGGLNGWTQCTNTSSSTNWSIGSSNHNKPLNGAPASYPSTINGCHSRDLNPSNGTALCTSGWTHHQASQITALSANWTINSITTGAWDAAFDIWYGNTAGAYDDLEIMIWFNSLGTIQPIGSVVASNVSIDGTLWNVWSGTGGPGGNPAISWDVISYVRVTKYNGGAVNVLPFQTDAIARSARADNNSWLTGLDVGFEIWQGGNGLGTTAFSVSKTTTSSGPTSTATRTATTAVGPTATRTPTATSSGSCNSTNATLITVGFTKDGTGTFCWKISSLGFINSWNLASLTVNGANWTNLYATAGQLGAQNGGYWYIAYNSTNAAGHFEAKS
jgi:hypothetical protein